MRKTVQPPLDHSRNNIDRRIRLVLTGNGPEYWNLEPVQQAALRRARSLYYTMDFAQLLFQKNLDPKYEGRAAEALGYGL